MGEAGNEMLHYTFKTTIPELGVRKGEFYNAPQEQ